MLTGAQRSRRQESETDTQQGVRSSFQCSSPLCLSGAASRHLSSSHHQQTFLHLLFPFFHPPLLVMCQSPLAPSAFSDGQIDNGTAARSGVRASLIPATCLRFFALSCVLSHDAKETAMIYIQSLSFLSFFFFKLHAPFVVLLGSDLRLSFPLFTEMKLSQPLLLTSPSAGSQSALLATASLIIRKQRIRAG